MRKLFIGTILVSLLGAAVIGAALAWTGNVTGPSSAQAGGVSVQFYGYALTGNKVVPDNQWIEVANGGLTNNGDIAVHVPAANAGSVVITNNPGGCADNILGAVNQASGTTVNPGGSANDPLYRVYLKMDTAAEDGCQNATITYDVTVNVES